MERKMFLKKEESEMRNEGITPEQVLEHFDLTSNDLSQFNIAGNNGRLELISKDGTRGYVACTNLKEESINEQARLIRKEYNAEGIKILGDHRHYTKGILIIYWRKNGENSKT